MMAIAGTAKLIESILRVVNIDNEALEYYNVFTDEGLNAFIATLKPREQYLADVANMLEKEMDNYPNLSSDDDYSFRDICGSYPNDDPRAGWWTISIGNTFINVIASTRLEGETDDDFEDRCEHHLNDDDIVMLVHLLYKCTCIYDIDEIEINAIVAKINSYNGSQKNICELFSPDEKVTISLNTTFMDMYHIQPGVIAYAIDPQNTNEYGILGNVAISVRYPNASNVIYTFDTDNGTVIRTTSSPLTDDIHKRIMQE